MIDYLEKLRLRLAGFNAQPVLAFLGLVCGLISGGIIILFRKTIENTQSVILPNDSAQDFELLETSWHFLLPFCGGLLLALLLYLFSKPSYRFGIVHIIERLAYFEGNMPFKNAVLQFFGAAIALISGHSVGREGPSAHLGAATSSLMGNYLQLPNNSIRTLVACGAAAAIAASFNTPLAGVIFTMEVIVLEYTIASVTPVILAAVSATVLTRWVFGTEPVFSVPAFGLDSIAELPIILCMGIAIGAFAAGFITLLQWVTEKGKEFPIWQKLIMAGIGAGVCALIVPEIMGDGYDTVNQAFQGALVYEGLMLIILFKVLATSISLGLGVPGGLIGPSLFIGAIAGAVTGIVIGYLPFETSHPGLYAMIGMGAMMAACLQAPLAALVTLLELTANPNIILPGMLAIVSAQLTTKEIFSKDSIFISQMKAFGLDHHNDPVAQSLRRLAVAAVMDREYVITEQVISYEQVEKLLKGSPRWLIIEREEDKLRMPASDLARYMEEDRGEGDGLGIDLLELPSHREQLAPIHLRATLQEAKEILDKTQAEALYVRRPIAPAVDRIYGLVDNEAIQKGYRL